MVVGVVVFIVVESYFRRVVCYYGVIIWGKEEGRKGLLVVILGSRFVFVFRSFFVYWWYRFVC